MSKNRQKLLPHPALTPSVGNGYQHGCNYQAEIQAIRADERRELYVALEHRLNCVSLKRLVEEGKAEYLSLADCPKTRKRAVFRGPEPSRTLRLNKTEFRGKITVSSYVCAAAEIVGHQAEDWLPEVKILLPTGIDLPKGAILAQAADSSFNPDKEQEQGSIMSIVPKDGIEPGRFQVELDEERIIVRVAPETRKEIDRARKSEGWKDAMWSNYLTVMVHAVQAHQEEEHQGKRWANRIGKALQRAGINESEPEELRNNALEYAQIMMNNPLDKLLKAATAGQRQEADD